MTGLISVILSTFDQPKHLERVLWGYARQTDRDFEIILADDGSGPETRALVERMRPLLGVPLTHVWHERDGFRKARIVNRAILAARGTYLITTDGDCIPPAWFVERHRRLARPGCFVSARYLRLDAAVTERLSVADVQSGRATSVLGLRRLGAPWSSWLVRLGLSWSLASLGDRYTRAGRAFNGCNCGVWRADALVVNGFEDRTVYGGEDLEFGERLERHGIRGIQGRMRLPVVHLDHARPYRTPGDMEHNLAIRSERRLRALVGIDQLRPADLP